MIGQQDPRQSGGPRRTVMAVIAGLVMAFFLVTVGVWFSNLMEPGPKLSLNVLFVGVALLAAAVRVVMVAWSQLRKMILWDLRPGRLPDSVPRPLPRTTSRDSPLWDRQIDG